MAYNLCVAFPDNSFSVETVRQIAALLGEFNLGEISLQSEPSGARLSLTRDVVFAAPVAFESVPLEASETITAEESAPVAPSRERFEVVAPCVGVFRAPKKPLAAGDEVKARQVVGNVEALHQPNEVHAPWDGKVVEILAFEGQAIEWGQPLLVLEPLK